jgi:hypothetical protein
LRSVSRRRVLRATNDSARIVGLELLDRMTMARKLKTYTDNLDGFADLYARARLVGYHTMADELIEIADNRTPTRMKSSAIGSASIPASGCCPRRFRNSTATS